MTGHADAAKIKPSALPCRFPKSDPDDWFAFPGSPKNVRAKGQCRVCPLTLQCRQVAIEDGIPEGVWGGLDGADRAEIWAADPAGKPDVFNQILDDALLPLLQERRDWESHGKDVSAFPFGVKTGAA